MSKRKKKKKKKVVDSSSYFWVILRQTDIQKNIFGKSFEDNDKISEKQILCNITLNK